MPLHVVLFEDDPARADVRPRLMPDHLAFLERRCDSIRAAGPLRDAAAGAPAGGLWLVEAPDAAAVEALVREDPFWPAVCADPCASWYGPASSPRAGG